MTAFNAVQQRIRRQIQKNHGSWTVVNQHTCYRRDFFSTFQEIQEQVVTLENNRTISVKGKGTIKIEKVINDKWYESTINEVLYIPAEFRKNLFSESVITKKGNENNKGRQ